METTPVVKISTAVLEITDPFLEKKRTKRMLCETFVSPRCILPDTPKIRDWNIQPRIFYVLCVMSVYSEIT